MFANETFDGFIKLLLRSYTEMVTEFIPINEIALSRKSAATRDTVYQYLVKLSSLNIIRYIKGKITVLLIFTKERLIRKVVMISLKNYLHVKEKDEIRLKKMIEYADSDNYYRSVFLFNYFGEEANLCGIYDVCRERNELNLSKYEFDLILEEIKTILGEKSLYDEDLVKMIEHPEDKVITVILWKFDHNKIVQDKDLKLM
jgi:ATP-dependent DNA helicase RecQ